MMTLRCRGCLVSVSRQTMGFRSQLMPMLTCLAVGFASSTSTVAEPLAEPQPEPELGAATTTKSDACEGCDVLIGACEFLKRSSGALYIRFLLSLSLSRSFSLSASLFVLCRCFALAWFAIGCKLVFVFISPQIVVVFLLVFPIRC